MEHQIPLAEIGVLPAVGHRDDVLGPKGSPVGVFGVPPFLGWPGSVVVSAQPPCHIPVVVLAAPEQPGSSRGMDGTVLLVESRCYPFQVVLPLPAALIHQGVERGCLFRLRGLASLVVVSAQSQAHRPDFSWMERALEMQRCFASSLCRIHRALLSVNQKAVKGIFHIGLLWGLSVEPFGVGFVFREQPRALFTAGQVVGGQAFDGITHEPIVLEAKAGSVPVRIPPAPGVPEPQAGKEMKVRVLRTSVGDGEPDQHIFGRSFRVLNVEIKKAIARKDACIDQFVFVLFSAAVAVFVAQLLVRKALMGVAIQSFRITTGWCTGEVIHRVFDVFSVVAFGIAETEQAFFENGILAVPEHGRETEQTAFVAQAQQAVLPPAVAAQVAVVEGKGVPGVAIAGIILADCAPLPITQIGPPAIPGLVSFIPFAATQKFRGFSTDLCGGTHRRRHRLNTLLIRN